MKLSCLPGSFTSDLLEGRMSIAEWARMAAAVDLDAIDLSIMCITDRSPQAVAAVRRDIQAAGMQVGMISTYPDFSHPDAAQRARELALEQEAVEVAAGLGAKHVRVTAGQAHPQTGVEEGIAWVAEGMRKLLESTRDSGVTLAYENHVKGGRWRYFDFSRPPEIFLRIVEATADVGFPVNYDTANATVLVPDPVTLLDQVMDRVVSVHAADTATRGVLQHVLLGTGITPFVPLFKRLHQAGFDGWMTIEEGSRMGQYGLEQSVRFVRETWAKTG